MSVNRSALYCVLAALCALFLRSYFRSSNDENIEPTSVWCHEHNEGLQCSFKNLYYHPRDRFVFLLTSDSIVSGLIDPSRLNRIPTSTVGNHSEFYLKVETRTSFNVEKFANVRQKLFVLQRFKPDNLLHVIHDDLLPLHATYQRLCFGRVEECTREYHLTLIDDHPKGPFFLWYSRFSRLPPMLFSDLDEDWRKLSDVKVGLLTKIVYQYGFGEVHGPLASLIGGRDVLEFREFILKKYPVHKIIPGFTLVSRRFTRRILNENYLRGLVTRSDFRSNLIDLMTNSTREVLTAVSNSDLLVTMHGAESILALFLPPNASVIELFPFGIVKEFVSPLLSYSRIRDVHFRYFSWTNSNESHSIPHPENPPLLGGIRHLNESLQRKIRETKTVPPVVCCHNPTYLYRMFQDTVVDSSVEVVVRKAMNSISKRVDSNPDHSKWFLPGHVRNLRCLPTRNGVLLHWEPPANAVHLEAFYDIVVAVSQSNRLFRTKIQNITLQLRQNDILEAWVCCTIGNVKGRDSYVTCNA